MRCPKCSELDTKVIDSRTLIEGQSIRRRRKCEACEFRFTTYERLEMAIPTIVKNDGRREPYNREKLIKGLRNACQKRPISMEQTELIAEELEFEMQQGQNKEYSTDQIGAYIMEKLQNIDPVSYIRYASFYWDYNTVDGFVSGLKNNVGHKRPNNQTGENNASIH